MNAFLGRRRLKQLTLPLHELLRMHSALCEMGKGTARREEWSDMADLVAAVDALARLAKVDRATVMPLVDEATAGLAIASKVPSGQMRVPHAAMHALRGIVLLYDGCLCEQGQDAIRDAIRIVNVADDVAFHGEPALAS